MGRPSWPTRRYTMPRTARQSTIQLLGALLALGVITLLVWTTTSAAFLDTTRNDGNAFGTGAVDLIDDDDTIALFNATDLAPGDSVEGCILVTYQGSITGGGELTDVRVYADSLVDGSGNGLGDWLSVRVEEGTAASFNDCTTFSSDNTVFDNVPLSTLAGQSFGTAAAGGWTPVASPESQAYRVTVTLDNNPPDAVEGDSVTAAFVWEVQTTP
jgi:hypothetical protein